MDGNNNTIKKYWRHWCKYVQPLRINPFLQTTAAREVILATTGFIDRVRRGYYGNGKHVIVQTPQVALSAISKTIELEGGVSPIYRGKKQVHHPNPAPNGGLPTLGPSPQTQALCTGRHSQHHIKYWKNINSAVAEATGKLCLVAFYFILRIREYTLPRVNNQGLLSTQTL